MSFEMEEEPENIKALRENVYEAIKAHAEAYAEYSDQAAGVLVDWAVTYSVAGFDTSGITTNRYGAIYSEHSGMHTIMGLHKVMGLYLDNQFNRETR